MSTLQPRNHILSTVTKYLCKLSETASNKRHLWVRGNFAKLPDCLTSHKGEAKRYGSYTEANLAGVAVLSPFRIEFEVELINETQTK